MAKTKVHWRWLKGKRTSGDGTYTYVNLYQVVAIQKENADDYIIHDGGSVWKLYNATVVENLNDIIEGDE